MSVAVILVTFAALEWREARGRERARVAVTALGALRNQEQEKSMGIILKAVFFGVSLTALSGCTTLRSQDAVGTGELLAAAGFHKQNADSAEHARNLASMPPFKLVARGMDDRGVVYTYADPVKCRCLYIGGPKHTWSISDWRESGRSKRASCLPKAAGWTGGCGRGGRDEDS